MFTGFVAGLCLVPIVALAQITAGVKANAALVETQSGERVGTAGFGAANRAFPMGNAQLEVRFQF